MKFQVPNSVIDIINIFEKAGYEIYLVGGAVRDKIIGRDTYDWDLTTNATPEQMLKIIPGGIYNNEFGTVFTPNIDDPERPHEITTFRKEEGYSDTRHPDKVSWGKTIEEDLQRRDFTINAIALKKIANDEDEYLVIDPYGGQSDIEKKVIRAVGDPDERFNEDALRMIRAIRIASELGFSIEEETLEAIKKNSPLINKVAKERIKVELFKLLASPFADEGIMLMRNSLLCNEILPELEKAFGVEQKSPGRHHIYDVGTHLVMALKNCKSTDPIVRFACLLHDIGKPATYRKLDSGVITFYNHELVSTRIANNIADRLKLSNKEKDKLVTLVRWHQFTTDETQTDSAIRRFIRNVGLENVQDAITLRIADRLGGGATETSWRLEDFQRRIVEVQKEPFSLKDIKIDGRDVMSILDIAPSPKIGEILNSIFEKVVNKELNNTKEDLTKYLEILKKAS